MVTLLIFIKSLIKNYQVSFLGVEHIGGNMSEGVPQGDAIMLKVSKHIS